MTTHINAAALFDINMFTTIGYLTTLVLAILVGSALLGVRLYRNRKLREAESARFTDDLSEAVNDPHPPHVPRMTPPQLHLLFRLGQLGTLAAAVGLIWSAATSHWVVLAIAAVTLLVSLYVHNRFKPMTPQRWSEMSRHV